jgi:dTMP kinase
MSEGKFITFEGPEGGGKSTHIRLLADFLRQRGFGVALTREPGGTPMGEAIRNLLQHNGAGEAPTNRAEVLLFLASRAQHVERLIRPALASGTWVLCDRFDASTFAYQGFGRGFDLRELKSVNAFATGGLEPDLTILLDVSRATSRQRLQMRQTKTATAPDRIECEAEAFHVRLRDGFLQLAQEAPQRYAVVNAEQELERVAAAVQSVVSARLLEGAACN